MVGFTMKTREDGSSGTAGIIWVEGAPMMHVRSGDGKHCGDMLLRSGDIAGPVISIADRGKDRPFSIGRMTAERSDEPATRQVQPQRYVTVLPFEGRCPHGAIVFNEAFLARS